MNLISAVDEIFLASESLISVRANRCLHAIDHLNTCDECVRACPVSAISLGDEPYLNGEKCLGCGLCLRLCPVGALRGEDGVEAIFRCVQMIGKTNSLELCCDRHPSPETGPADARVVLKSDRCLGSLGPSVYLTLFMMGVFKIVLRMDACCDCGSFGACEHIRQAAESANTFFTSAFAGGRPVVAPVARGPQPDWTRRPVVDVKRPPMSRKSFLTNMLSLPRLTGIARYVTETTASDAAASLPSIEKQRMAKVLELYGEVVPAERQACLEQFLPNDLLVAESCVACGVCATICRTGALEFVEDKNHHFQLLFSPAHCSGCGVCQDYCEAGAIRLQKRATAWSTGQDQTALARPSLARYPVISGELHRCERCHAYFKQKTQSGASTGSDLCPICDFRRSNPFGFALPRNTALVQKSR